MSKIELKRIMQAGDVSLLNVNFDRIQSEFQNKVLYRDNPESEPNTLATDVDCNGKRLYNLPVPLSPNDAARLKDVNFLSDLSIVVEDIPHGEPSSGDFDIDTGVLTLRIPEGKDGKEGPSGANGVIVEMSGLYGFEIRGDNLFMVYDEGGIQPDISISSDGDLIWRG